MGSVFLSIYLLGAFSFDSFSDPGGWGENSMNLNSLLNPIGNMSKFLTELPMVSSMQAEGGKLSWARSYYLVYAQYWNMYFSFSI